MKMRLLYGALALGLLGVFGVVGAGLAADAQQKTTAPTKEQSDAVRAQGRYLATITMENGKKIEIVLEGAEAPYTSANFIQLAKIGLYDGLTFHRVEPNFVIQGGDPKGDGTGGPGFNIKLEISPFLTHKRGAISMASTQKPDSAGCQFFITTGDSEFLDSKYAVFGWVKSGMEEVVDKVKAGDKMKTIVVEPYDGKEACPILR